MTQEMNNRILKLLENSDLPVLPQICQRITEITDHSDSSVQDLSKIILEDQVLTGKVLSIANTPFYGIGQRVSTITMAVRVLGFTTIRNVVLMVSVADSLMEKFSGEAFEGIWVHSLGCGVAAQMLAQKTGSEPEMALIAGLLHDCGRLFLRHCMPDEYERVNLAVAKGEKTLEAEARIFECTHQETGKMITEAWRLPDTFVAVTEDHHYPMDGEFLSMRKLIHLANQISHYVFVDPWARITDRKKAFAAICTYARNHFDLENADIQKVTSELAGKAEEIIGSLNIKLSTKLSDLLIEESPTADEDEKPVGDLIKKAEKMNRQLAFLSEISALATDRSVKLDEIMQATLEGVFRGIGFSRALLLVRKPGAKNIICHLALGHDTDSIAGRIKIKPGKKKPGLIEKAMTTGLSFNILDTTSPMYAHLPPMEIQRLLDTTAFAIVPLPLGEEIIGCVLVDNEDVGETITDSDVTQIRTFINIADLALQNRLINKRR